MTVGAVADAIETSGASAADLQALHAVLRAAVQEGISAGLAAQRINEQTSIFPTLERFLQANAGLSPSSRWWSP
jgi:hypothetical protein